MGEESETPILSRLGRKARWQLQSSYSMALGPICFKWRMLSLSGLTFPTDVD